jgi:hypothetical protein
MWYSSTEAHEAVSAGPERSAVGPPNDPTIEIVYLLAGALMEVLGPLFWAVLIVGFLFAEFWPD